MPPMREENFDSPPNDEQKKQAEESEKANPTTDPEKDLIKQCLEEVKIIRQNRLAFEKQALVNVAFLYGKHYFTIEKNSTKSDLTDRVVWELKSLEKAKRTRKIVNYTLPLYRSLLSRMIQMKQRVVVDPLTNQDRDISAARVADEALEDFQLNVNKENPILRQRYAGMPQILVKLFGYMLAVGRGHLLCYFNPKAKAKVFFENLQDRPIVKGPVGAVEVEVEHWLNVFPDPMGRYKTIKKIFPVEYIKELYDVDVKAEDVGLTDIEKQMVTLLEGGQDEKFKDCAEVYTRFELPTTKDPQGRLFVCTKDRMLVKPQPLPPECDGSIPVFDFDFLDIMGAHPQGVVEQLIPSQEELNHTVSRLHEYKKWMAGKILVPDGCDLQSGYNDQVGQVIKYAEGSGKPEFQVPPSPPAFLMGEISRIKKDMEDIAATHDASQGRQIPGVKSGVAIENLSELDQSQLTPQLLMIETQLSFFYDAVLTIMEKKYTEQRLIGITGDHLSSDVQTFVGSKVAGNRRIKVSLGNNLPVGREARQETIAGWLKAGLISKEEARGMLEFGTLDSVFHSIDENAEKTETQERIRGIDTQAQSWENHAVRLKVLTDFMMGDYFVKLMKKSAPGPTGQPQDPQAAAITQAFLAHRKQHQDFLTAEMKPMLGGPGQQPPTPAPGAAGQ